MSTRLARLGLAMGVVVGGVAAGQAAVPGFGVESNVVDVGTVYSGSVGEAEFVFHNPTDRDVRILRAKPT